MHDSDADLYEEESLPASNLNADSVHTGKGNLSSMHDDVEEYKVKSLSQEDQRDKEARVSVLEHLDESSDSDANVDSDNEDVDVENGQTVVSISRKIES